MCLIFYAGAALVGVFLLAQHLYGLATDDRYGWGGTAWTGR